LGSSGGSGMYSGRNGGLSDMNTLSLSGLLNALDGVGTNACVHQQSNCLSIWNLMHASLLLRYRALILREQDIGIYWNREEFCIREVELSKDRVNVAALTETDGAVFSVSFSP